VRTLIASRRVVLGGRGTPLRAAPACLLVDGPRIAAVHELVGDYASALRAVAETLPGPVVFHDHGDALVTPAFVNAHTHLVLGFLRSFDAGAAARANLVEDFFFGVERRLAPSDARAFARMGAYESLAHGVGLVWEHYYHGEEVAQALLDVGLPGVVAPTLQDLSGPGKAAWEAQLAATEAIDAGAAFRAGGVFAALGPHATDTVSAELLERAMKVAEARRLPVHLHLAQSADEVERVTARYGVTPLRWLDGLGLFARTQAVCAHAIFVPRADLARLGRSRHALVWCPSSAFVFAMPARIAVWSELEVPWVLGTDCAASNDGMNLQAELKLVSAQRAAAATWSAAYDAVLAAPDAPALAAATAAAWQTRADLFAAYEPVGTASRTLERAWGGAGCLHPAFRAGVLEAGALANVLVWDVEHPAFWPAHDPLATLVMADATKALHTMYAAGRPVTAVGEHQSLAQAAAYREALGEARARLEKLGR
jgi:5-methylthioadenosine/S-adenosylhomocysteine deaminase